MHVASARLTCYDNLDGTLVHQRNNVKGVLYFIRIPLQLKKSVLICTWCQDISNVTKWNVSFQ